MFLRYFLVSIFFSLITVSLPAQDPRLVLQLGHLEALENGSDVLSIDISRNGKWTVTAARDGQAKLWDVATGRLLYSLTADPYSCSAFFACNDSLLLTGGSTSLKAWHTQTARQVYEIPGENFAMQDFLICTDDRYFFSRNNIYSALTGKKIDSIPHEISPCSMSGTGLGTEGQNIPLSDNRTPVIYKDRYLFYADNNGQFWQRDILQHRSERIWTFKDTEKHFSFFNKGKLYVFDQGSRLHILDATSRKILRSQVFPLQTFSNIFMINEHTFAFLQWNDSSSTVVLTIANDKGQIINSKKEITASERIDGSLCQFGDKLACKINDTTVVILDGQSNRIIHQIPITQFEKPALLTSDQLALLSYKYGRLVDLNSGNSVTLDGASYTISYCNLNRDASFATTVSARSNQIKVWDPRSGQFIYNILGRPYKYKLRPYESSFSLSGKKLMFYSQDGDNYLNPIRVWDLENNRLVYELNEMESRYSMENATENHILTPGNSNYYYTIANDRLGGRKWLGFCYDSLSTRNSDLETDPLFSEKNTRNQYKSIISDDGELLAIQDENDHLLIRHVSDSSKYLYKTSIKAEPVGFCELKTGSALRAVNNSDEFYIDILSRRVLRKEEIHFAAATEEKQDLYIEHDRETHRVYRTKDSTLLYTFIPLDSTDYFTIIPAGFYMCTPAATKKLHYVSKDLQVISFEQLDLRYNRPDKVLEYIGSKDSLLIRAYQRAYYKRIKRQGLDTMVFRSGYDVPVVRIVNDKQLSNITSEKTIRLHITAEDKKYDLDRLLVSINNVPVFGSKGISLLNRNKGTLDTTISVELEQGQNQIRISVLNRNGIESYQQPRTIYQKQAAAQEKMHFIGIGIDRFRDSLNDLRYSVKDIRNLAEMLQNKYKGKLVIDTIFNEQVTVKNISALKEKLKQTHVNDKVIIAYSGHGLLSREFDYYLSTYTVNFQQPSENGLPYEQLEGLLDDIPARKKLLLIDACHSGEVDKEELQRINSTSDSLHLSRGGITVAYKEEGHLGMKNSFELMQNLFANVGKTTGATIISAAGGTQFALERGDLQNGVFTWSILKAMNDQPRLKISSLKKFVSQEVEKITQGMQKPTYRSENAESDWELY